MRAQRFGAVVAAGPRGRAVIVVPFDPDEVWGTKAEHPVGGTVDGRRVRGRVVRVVDLLAAGVKQRPRS
jgi:hypothetical protein